MAGVSSYVVCEHKNSNMSVVVVLDPKPSSHVDCYQYSELSHLIRVPPTPYGRRLFAYPVLF